MIQKKKKKKKKRRRRRKKKNPLVTLKYVMRRRKKVMTVRGCLLTSFGHVAQSEQVMKSVSKEFLMQRCSRHMKLGKSIFICILFVVDTALLTVNTFFLVQARDQTPLLKSQTKVSFSQTGTKQFGQFGRTVNNPIALCSTDW